MTYKSELMSIQPYYHYIIHHTLGGGWAQSALSQYKIIIIIKLGLLIFGLYKFVFLVYPLMRI